MFGTFDVPVPVGVEGVSDLFEFPQGSVGGGSCWDCLVWNWVGVEVVGESEVDDLPCWGATGFAFGADWLVVGCFGF